MSDEQKKLEAEAPEVWPRVVKLKHPFDFGTERIAELEFRRGKLGHMNGIKLKQAEVSTDDLITIASRMCGKQRQVIENLDPDDAEEVLGIALDFFVKCLPAPGKKQSGS